MKNLIDNIQGKAEQALGVLDLGGQNANALKAKLYEILHLVDACKAELAEMREILKPDSKERGE
jgi:hypothetical protein